MFYALGPIERMKQGPVTLMTRDTPMRHYGFLANCCRKRKLACVRLRWRGMTHPDRGKTRAGNQERWN